MSLVESGIRPEQGPPLSVPMSFFALAPVAMVFAGGFLFLHPQALASRWLGSAMTLVHVGTLGVLGAVMLGALYQMLPVVAGSPVPWPRLAHAVHALYALGIVALTSGFATEEGLAFSIGGSLLAAALALFLVQSGLALARAEARSATVTGMRLAVLGLALTAAVGVALTWFRSGAPWTVDQRLWSGAHYGLGAIVWVGGLITAVSWQVVPMFYLAAPYPLWSQRLGGLAIAASGVGLMAALALGLEAGWLQWLALPGAAAVWLLHPAVTIQRLRRRRRARADGSLRFWYAGLASAPAVFVLLYTLQRSAYPDAAALVAWTALWGWAAMIAHGMLTRIVPFLVWFHRYSKLVGRAPVPSMNQLWPPSQIALGFAAHALSLVVGEVAIVTQSSMIIRATAIGLTATGVVLGAGLARALRETRTRALPGSGRGGST